MYDRQAAGHPQPIFELDAMETDHAAACRMRGRIDVGDEGLCSVWSVSVAKNSCSRWKEAEGEGAMAGGSLREQVSEWIADL